MDSAFGLHYADGMRIAVAPLLALGLVPAAHSQTVRHSGLPVLSVEGARYDSRTERLSFRLSCASDSPLTAWGYAISATYEDGGADWQAAAHDFAVQLAHPNRSDSQWGICSRGQLREHTAEVANRRAGAQLKSLHVEVTVAVDANLVASGKPEEIAEIDSRRAEELVHKREWRLELEQMLASPDPHAAVLALADKKRRLPVRGGEVERVDEVRGWIEEHGVAPREALAFHLKIAAEEERVYERSLLTTRQSSLLLSPTR